MTLGLVTSDSDAIYLAIESEGLPARGEGPPRLLGPRNLLLDSKIIELQCDPGVTLLVAGGLEHWCYVVGHFTHQPSLLTATEEVRRLLDQCMTSDNQAYGRVCGYENERPTCYRVDRQCKQEKACRSGPIDLDKTEVIGSYREAASNADKKIAKNMDRLRAIVEAIDMQLGKPNVKPPIHVRIARRKDR